MIRPEMRQYFFENDNDKSPFSRTDRSLVYQRAKQQLDKRPFGTQGDVYKTDFEWINHSMDPVQPDTSDFRIRVGGPDRSEERRGGKECVSTCSFRWSTYHYKKHKSWSKSSIPIDLIRYIDD